MEMTRETHKHIDKVHPVANKRKMLAFFAIPKKKGGKQTLNRFDICNKSSQIPRKNEFGSLTKSFDSLVAKILYPEKVIKDGKDIFG